jgi:membrane protease YdiL (CAAX protease family)
VLETLPGLLGTALLSSLWAGALALTGGALSAEPLRGRLGLLRPRLGGGAIAIAVVGGLAVSQAADALLQWSGVGRGAPLEQVLAILRHARGPGLAAALVVIGLAAGTCEELFFRGYLQRRLTARFGGAVGVAVAALAFAVAHVEPRHAAFAFAFGLYVGWLAWMSRSVWPGVAVHVANNMASVLLVAFGLDDAAAPAAAHALTFAVSVVVLLVAIALLRRAGRRAAAAACALDDPGGPLVGSAP